MVLAAGAPAAHHPSRVWRAKWRLLRTPVDGTLAIPVSDQHRRASLSIPLFSLGCAWIVRSDTYTWHRRQKSLLAVGAVIRWVERLEGHREALLCIDQDVGVLATLHTRVSLALGLSLSKAHWLQHARVRSKQRRSIYLCLCPRTMQLMRVKCVPGKYSAQSLKRNCLRGAPYTG